MLVVSQDGKTVVNTEHAAKIVIRTKRTGKEEAPKPEYYIAADNSLETKSHGFVLAFYSTEDKAIAALNELIYRINEGRAVYCFPPDIMVSEASE